MLLVSRKMVFMEKKGRVIMRDYLERARAFVATILCIKF